MVKLYVFWGIFALVLMGVGLTIWRERSARHRNRAATHEFGARVASGRVPAATPAEAAFDPGATRIHFRMPTRDVASASIKRGEVTLPSSRSARLVCVGGTLRGSSFCVAEGGLTVGRDPSNDLVIADPRVSSIHAWVGLIDRKAVLRDLGSTNGTFLNARIDSPVSEVVLSPGDTIFFGGHGREQFRFVVD